MNRKEIVFLYVKGGERMSDDARYVCSVCYYEYEGETPFEELPEDYVCPICGQPKEVFEKQ